ncbi:hypothetical protein MHU86_25910 [Fragilaria crotonensis]|nr:hypothetical protein MHU86_25910 [Fragilaria crotonensis]
MVAKQKKKKKNNTKNISKQDNEAEEKIDERFIAAVTRPQFQRPKEEQTKVVLDDRFASVLTDPKFSLQTKDRYGRRIKKKSGVETELKEFYTVEKKAGDTDEHDDIEDDHSVEVDGADVDDGDSDSESDDNEEDKDPASRIAYLTALSRGELDVSESSDDDSGSESDEDVDSDLEEPVLGKAGILDPTSRDDEEVSLTNVPSPYMAVLHMDWSHVRAVDVFAILASFTSPGSIRKVQVYPSDYGLERMEKEKVHGPIDIWKKKKSKNAELDDEDEDEDDDVEDDGEEDDEDVGDHDDEVGSDEDRKRAPAIKFELDDEDVDPSFDPEKLRAYEASKLKYYFAIVQFASPEHADAAYKEVDGLELEHSSASIDMRSIDPDQLEGIIKGRQLRDEASTIPSNYKPPEFVISALQQTNVKCTWDEGDVEREQKLTKYMSSQGWSELADSEDLRAYIASDHSSDDDSNAGSVSGQEKKGSNLRKMLGLDSDDDGEQNSGALEGDNESDDDQDFGDDNEKQVSFIPGKEKLVETIRSKISGAQQTELTPWEKYQEKRKQKRREKRQSRRKHGKEGDNGSESDDEPAFDDDDGFFVDEERGAKTTVKKRSQKNQDDKKMLSDDAGADRAPSTKEELQLLVAGEEGDEDALDYDMRGLVRMDKLKDHKLKGARKGNKRSFYRMFLVETLRSTQEIRASLQFSKAKMIVSVLIALIPISGRPRQCDKFSWNRLHNERLGNE